jgi:predicted dehydrogenase
MAQSNPKLRVAVVGLRFGASFVPIYRNHPDVAEVAICDMDPEKLKHHGDKHGVARRFSRLEEVLAAKDIDAVHIVTPMMFHADHAPAVLDAGKHCACAVPMAVDIAGLERVLAAQQKSGMNYMMMETAVYTKEFLLAKDMAEKGEFGRFTFFRGAHLQDHAEDHPYWWAIPPMKYITHAAAPFLALAGTRAVRVTCLGSGRLRPEVDAAGGPYPGLGESPFPLEVAVFRLAKDGLAAEVTRSLFQVARTAVESFSAYGEKKSFEWQQLPGEGPVVFEFGPPLQKGWEKSISRTRVHPPDRLDLIPPEIAQFTQGGHSGSHPHLVHEFVRSIIEERRPAVDAVTAAHWTAPGICAHESALKNGEPVDIPAFA